MGSCCGPQRKWSGRYLQMETLLLSYKVRSLGLSALGSRISTSRISWGGGCHTEVNLAGDQKPSQTLGAGSGSCPRSGRACSVSGEGEEHLCSWIKVSLSARPGQNTHIHTQACTQAVWVEHLHDGRQPASCTHGGTPGRGGIPALPAPKDTTGPLCSPLLGTATSKHGCEV